MFENNIAAQQNIEILWRLARACYAISKHLESKNPTKKKIIVEGHKYAVQAYGIDSDNYNVLRWAGVLTGQLIDYLGTKEKIEQGYHFKVEVLILNSKRKFFIELFGQSAGNQVRISVISYAWPIFLFGGFFVMGRKSNSIDIFRYTTKSNI